MTTAEPEPAPGPDLWHQLSVDTGSCYWCELPAVGTARDKAGRMHYSCGQKGHGES